MTTQKSNNQKLTKQTTTKKILWGIFNLLEIADDFSYPFSRQGLYDRAYGGGYGDIIRKIRWRKSRQRFAQFINNLKRQGYIKIKIQKDKKAIILTPKGFEKILKTSIEQSDKKKRRDGKWQMVIWDIPEDYKQIRNKFRNALKLLGYQQLQKSVWICPYDILKETEKIIRLYHAESYVKIFLISEIEI